MNRLTVILAASLLLATAAALYSVWFMSSSRIDDAYLDAASDCAAGLGDGRLQALDAMYGRDSRPRELAVELSLCALGAAVDRYTATIGALDALAP